MRRVRADGHYTRTDWIRAVNWAAVLGWTMVVLPDAFDGSDPHKAIFYFFMAALFGLPIAFAASWLIGAPILHHLMNRRIGWLRAILWGGGIAALIKALAIILGQMQHWIKRHSSGSFGFSDAHGPIIIDNMRTAYGWQLVAERAVWFVLAGIVAALIVRTIIGPGRPTPGLFNE